jgi:fructose PTS system EIIA component
MNLVDVLDERIIEPHLPAKNKKEAIQMLAEKLKEAGYIKDVEMFIKDIYYRESQGITGIGNYIAIPHGKSDSVVNVGVAIAKLDYEIDWETLDDKGVKIIVLFAVSNNNEYAENHMHLLADVASKLGKKEAIVKLIDAKTKEDIINVFCEEV